MLAHDARSGIQSQPRSLANAFGGEKWFKDVWQDFIRNPGTVVRNLHHYACVFTIGAEAKLTLATHRVNRIVDNVGPDLVQFAAKGIHEEWNPLIVTLDRNSAL